MKQFCIKALCVLMLVGFVAGSLARADSFVEGKASYIVTNAGREGDMPESDRNAIIERNAAAGKQAMKAARMRAQGNCPGTLNVLKAEIARTADYVGRFEATYTVSGYCMEL